VNIVNNIVNDVALTVLDGAAIDPLTGITTVCQGIATDGGVSIIDGPAGVGTVVDITVSYWPYTFATSVLFVQGGIWIDIGSDTIPWIYSFYPVPASDNVITIDTKAGSSQDATGMYESRDILPSIIDLHLLNDSEGYSISEGSLGSSLGLTLLNENTTTPAEGSVAYITDEYNTGWMKGDIRLATLSDTVAGDIVEKVVNGDFTTDSDWTDYLGSSIGGTVVITGGSLLTTQGSNSVWLGAYQAIQVVAGVQYRASLDVLDAVESQFYAGTTLGASNVFETGTSALIETREVFFTPSTSGTIYVVILNGGSVGFSCRYDNATIHEVIEDRCVKDNPLQVVGELTKAPVATGAELVAYSGFSATDYIEQPYTADLDFGTGDFCVMGWVKQSSGGDLEVILQRSNNGGGDYGLISFVTPGNTLTTRIGTQTLTTTPTISNEFTLISIVRASGIASVYFNGILVHMVSAAQSIGTGYPLTVGSNAIHNRPLTTGSIALLRISATAPTDAEILDIYNQEKLMFREDAKCTLQGTSTSVQALDYDELTDQLYAGTADGVTTFKGLTVIDHLRDDADITSVSTNDGMYLTGTPSDSEVFIPAMNLREEIANIPEPTSGWSGTYANGDAATVTVVNGIITGVA